MNNHYILFQDSLNWFKKNPSYLDITKKEICSDVEDKEVCIEKHKEAFNFVVNTLHQQLDYEEYLDKKYEKMDRFKKIRGDKDANMKIPF